MKTYITAEQAKAVLPAEETIHTFYQFSLSLVGADWSRKEIYDKLETSDVIELTGSMARSMNHGICAYNKSSMIGDVLFIETDEEKLAHLEKEMTKDCEK